MVRLAAAALLVVAVLLLSMIGRSASFLLPARSLLRRATLAVVSAPPPLCDKSLHSVAPFAGVQSADSPSATPKPQVIFVLGGPGSGKGTQSARLAADYGFEHLSAGELLRQERASGSPDGKLIDDYIKDGRIVPVELSLGLLRKAMVASPTHRFLIDGFPRNQDNLEGWERMMKADTNISAVLWLDCPEDVLLARLLERGLSSGRTDDNEESARKRFKTYVETTMPVLEYYRGKGLVHRIQAVAGIDEVYESTVEAVEPLVEAEVRAACSSLWHAASAGDWDSYSFLSEPRLTYVGGESSGGARECFEADRNIAASGVAHVHVKVLGKVAVTSCRRGPDDALRETRVWRIDGGRWRQLHAHLSTDASN